MLVFLANASIAKETGPKYANRQINCQPKNVRLVRNKRGNYEKVRNDA